MELKVLVFYIVFVNFCTHKLYFAYAVINLVNRYNCNNFNNVINEIQLLYKKRGKTSNKGLFSLQTAMPLSKKKYIYMYLLFNCIVALL